MTMDEAHACESIAAPSYLNVGMVSRQHACGAPIESSAIDKAPSILYHAYALGCPRMDGHSECGV